MQKRNYLRVGLVAASFAALIAFMGTSTRPAAKFPHREPVEACCQKKTQERSAGNMIFENFSRQFFSFSSASD
jgi:hypothetical protein